MKPETRTVPKFLLTREEAAFALGLGLTEFDRERVRFEIPFVRGEEPVGESRRGRGRIRFHVRDIRRVAEALPEMGSRRNFEARLREARERNAA